MRVTKIEAQVKTAGRYSIYIDDKFSFCLNELALINSGLKIGYELDKSQLDQLKQNAVDDKLYDRCLDLVSRRSRSEWEISDYLKRKGAEPPVIDKIINRLRDRGFVDDLEFARRWIANRRLLKPISKRKLTLELRQKRVSPNFIEQAIGEDDYTDSDALQDEIVKKRRLTRYQDDQKLMQHLARQGYRFDDIKAALLDNAS